MTLLPGQPFADGYELLRPLGEGGMGEVWLARERTLGRDVALKIMRPSEGAARALRFAREAQALAALDHPSILPVLHTGEDPATGLRFFATRPVLLAPDDIRRLCDEVLFCPYPHGFTLPGTGTGGASPPGEPPGGAGGCAPRPLPLSALLDGGKTLPEAAVLRIARDLSGAIAAAHAAGILHRDVKPSNILFDPSGRVLLADFGLAKFTRGGGGSHAASAESAEGPDGRAPSRPERGSGTAEALDSISLDESGSRKFLGSPSYAAPETFRDGAPPAPALDWYSLGAVLYEALTGERPRSLRKPSSFDPARISRRWDSLLRDLLEPDPAQRLADPAAIARRLDALARAIAPATRRRRRTAGFALAAITVLAAVAAALYFHAEPVPAPGGGSGEAEPPPVVASHAEFAEIAEAHPMPPRLPNDVWQGHNHGPLQLLGVFRLASVERLSDEALAAADPETSRLLREGDEAWVSWETDTNAIVRAANAWSAAVARLEDAQSAGEAPPHRLLRAFALVRFAWTRVASADIGAADEPFRKALAAIDPLVESDPSRYGALRSWILSERGYMKCMEERFPESVADLREAGLLWTVHAPQNVPGYNVQSLVLAASLGGMFQAVGDASNAVMTTSRAADALESFLFPDEPAGGAVEAPQSLVDLLAGCCYRLGELHRELGGRIQSIAAYRRAADLWRDLFRTCGERYRGSCIQALGRLGQSLADAERLEEAVAVWDEIRDLVAPVFASDPALYRPVVAATLDNLVRANRALGDEERARALEAEAAALAQP